MEQFLPEQFLCGLCYLADLGGIESMLHYFLPILTSERARSNLHIFSFCFKLDFIISLYLLFMKSTNSLTLAGFFKNKIFASTKL